MRKPCFILWIPLVYNNGTSRERLGLEARRPSDGIFGSVVGRSERRDLIGKSACETESDLLFCAMDDPSIRQDFSGSAKGQVKVNM